MVAVYDIEKLLKESGEPIATFETPGLPTAVAIKSWKDRRYYAVSCNRSSDISLYDAETLDPAGKLSIDSMSITDIKGLGCSKDPDDPFLYFTAIESYKEFSSTYKTNVVGRFDMSNMQLDSKTPTPKRGQRRDEADTRLAVSADGSILFGRNASYRYEKLPGDGKVGVLTKIHEIETYRGGLPMPGPFGNQSFASFQICSHDLFVTENAGVILLAGGEKNAVFLGVSAKPGRNPADSSINLISANNYKSLAKVSIGTNIYSSSSSSGGKGDRRRIGMWGFIDETRDYVIVANNNRLAIQSGLLGKVPREPLLTITSKIPRKVGVGTEISIPLESPSQTDVTYELITDSPYYDPETDPFIKSKHQIDFRETHAFSPFKNNYEFRSGKIKNAIVMLRAPNGKWVREFTTKEIVYSDANGDGKVDRTDDESNPDRREVAVETFATNDRYSITYTPNSDVIRSLLNPRFDSSGKFSEFASARPVHAAICRQSSNGKVTVLSDVKTFHVVVRDSEKNKPGSRTTYNGINVRDLKQPTRNYLGHSNFRRQTKMVNTAESPIAINGNVLTWTPGPKQIGKRALGIRARSGEIVKDMYFGIDVEVTGASASSELPFYVNGISFQRDSDLAVIWGNDSASEVTWQYNKRSSDHPPGTKFLLGVYDWKQGKVLRHKEVAEEIELAAISPSGICTMASNPSRLIRYDHNTLKPLNQVPLKNEAKRIVVVNDRYVATAYYGIGERFELPNLDPIHPEVPTADTLLAEHFGDGWMWEGILWDKAMREPKLYAMPIAFHVGTDRNDRGHISGFKGAARIEPAGPVLLTLLDINSQPKGLSIPVYPARLEVHQEQQREGPIVIGEMHFEHRKSIRKVIVPQSRMPSSAKYGQKTMFVANGSDQSAAIIYGKIVLIPYTLWELPDIGFNFEPIQSTFALNPTRPTNVQYSAPGAVSYHLRIMSGFTYRHGSSLTSDSNAKLLFEGTSKDGSFEIAFDSLAPLASVVKRTTGINSFANRNRDATPQQIAQRNSEMLLNYRKNVTDTYRNLTGRAPRQYPVPVYAYVTAEDEHGEKAALFHAYLVELTLKQVNGTR